MQVVTHVSEKKRASRSLEAIKAGLAVDIDGDLYDAASVQTGENQKF